MRSLVLKEVPDPQGGPWSSRRSLVLCEVSGPLAGPWSSDRSLITELNSSNAMHSAFSLNSLLFRLCQFASSIYRSLGGAMPAGVDFIILSSEYIVSV
jgi:hypothetical protein